MYDCFHIHISGFVQIDPITPAVGAESRRYSNETLPSNMSENFRSYMDHLAHLTSEADHLRRLGPEVEDQTRWGDNVVEMCSDESDSEECPVDHYSNRDHLQRNPNFPYESLASPRVAWGERPREAWNDDVSEQHMMFDSTNPYALFNLPHPGLRGSLHHHKRKQNVKPELSHMHRDDKSGRQDVIRRKNATHPSRTHETHRKSSTHLNLGDNQSGHEIECPQTSQPRFDCESHSGLVCENFRRRQPQFGTGEIRTRINPRCSSPYLESQGMLPSDTVVLDENSMRDTFHITRQGSFRGSPQPSTSGGLCHPRFRTQESMDTNSDSEECSDIDVMTVPHLHHTHDVNGNPCSGHTHRDKFSSKSNTIVRPKAVKGESSEVDGRFDRGVSEDNFSGSCCKTNSENGRSSMSAVSQDSRCASPNLGIPLPGLSSSSNDYRSSEARVLHMDTHQHSVVQPQPCHLKNLSSKKSHKDKHNSVIKCKGAHKSFASVDRSIDLTSNESESASSRFQDDENVRPSSPVIQDVHLASASDDSDIEVVKIETSR